MLKKLSDLLIVWAFYTFVVTVVMSPIWAMLICLGGVSPWALLSMPFLTIFSVIGLYNQYGKAKDE